MPPRFVATLLAGFLVALAVAGAHARGDTQEDIARAQADGFVAPLALSADGRWLLNVDARNVLHRVNLADPAQQRAVSLPTAMHMLSASRSGQKVAFATTKGCVGLVDFGTVAGAVTRTTWQPAAPVHGAPLAAWSDAPPTGCVEGLPGGVTPGHSIVALSANGRLLATRDEVVDTGTFQRVATLPLADDGWTNRSVLKLRFVDGDARLLIVTATFGAGDESIGDPSDLRVAVWDLATRSLQNLLSHENAALDTPHALFADFSPQTNVFTWVDTQRYRDGLLQGGQAASLPPHDLVQAHPGSCDALQKVRFALSPDSASELVIDPWGRWIAEVRPVVDAKPGDIVAHLVVTDIDSRRVLSSVPLRQAIRGLVATPDGATILALAASMEVLSFQVDLPASTTPKAVAGAWDTAACRAEDEAAGARATERVTRALPVLWTRPHAAPDCLRGGRPASPFVMRDGTLWLDQGATIAQLDPASGKTLRSLPTPRSDKVCSVPVPTADGFVNVQGDTLTWRPFDGKAPAAAGRRVIDTRPGWVVEELTSLGRSLRVVWTARPGTWTRTTEGGSSEDLVVVLYDAASGRRLREFPQDNAGYGVVGDTSEVHWLPKWLPRCQDDQGPVVAGIDWRFDALGSLRATRCMPGDARTTIAWFGLDISPRAVAPPTDGPVSQLTSVDGLLAASIDGHHVRAFDLEARRELGQVTLAPTQRATWLRVLADQRLLLVETIDDASGPDRPTLRAWSLK